jgi:hypothetical protein
MEERQLVRGRDDLHAETGQRTAERRLWLRGFRRELREELVRRDPHGARQSFLVLHSLAYRCRDRVTFAVQPPRAGHVEERLVQADRLHQWRERLEDLHHSSAHLAVVLMVAWEEHGVRTQAARPSRRHRGMDPVVPRLVARGGDHAALTGAADDHRLTAQLRTAQQLDGHEERVHVDMQDRAIRHHDSPTRNRALSGQPAGTTGNGMVAPAPTTVATAHRTAPSRLRRRRR